jgi:hypothetical protein
MDERLDFHHPLWDIPNVATFKYCCFHHSPTKTITFTLNIQIEALIQGGKLKRFTLKWNYAGYKVEEIHIEKKDSKSNIFHWLSMIKNCLVDSQTIKYHS